MNDNGRLASGFTLAEILISTLVLSIFAVGTFKSSQFAQSGATTSLLQFKQLNRKKQAIAIRKLGKRYSSILVDDSFTALQCLIHQHPVKEFKPKSNCS